MFHDFPDVEVEAVVYFTAWMSLAFVVAAKQGEWASKICSTPGQKKHNCSFARSDFPLPKVDLPKSCFTNLVIF